MFEVLRRRFVLDILAAVIASGARAATPPLPTSPEARGAELRREIDRRLATLEATGGTQAARTGAQLHYRNRRPLH